MTSIFQIIPKTNRFNSILVFLKLRNVILLKKKRKRKKECNSKMIGMYQIWKLKNKNENKNENKTMKLKKKNT